MLLHSGSFRVNRFPYALLLIGALFATGCSGGSGPSSAPVAGGNGPGHREQPLALTPQQELKIGREAYQQVLSQGDVARSGAQVDRVTKVGQKIAKVIEIRPLMKEINLDVKAGALEWEYAVIKTDQVNAFCLPGGKIAVFAGLLKMVDNDDQLAAVMAHEIAHALAHHSSERVARERAGNRGFTSLAYDRQQESEADHIGVFLMTFAGYRPEEALKFWQKMESQSGSRGHLPEILSDHPSDARRIAQIKEWVPAANAAEEALRKGRIAPGAK